MLGREEARTRLKEFAAAPEVVPEPLVFKADPRGGAPAEGILTALNRKSDFESAAQTLDALSSADRTAVLEAVAPQWGEALARWWTWSAGAPYQTGAWRRAFRSTRSDDTYRSRWFILEGCVHMVQKSYPQSPAWAAAWLAHLRRSSLMGVFAAAMDAGDDEIRNTLVATVRGEHEISGPSRYAYGALLASADPANWEFVGNMLADASSAEGLRSVIMEATDLGTPGAMAHIIDVVMDQGLVRFPATAKAVSVWLGEDFNSSQEAELTRVLTTIRRDIEELPTAAQLSDRDPVDAFVGMWTLGIVNVNAAIPVAVSLLNHDEAAVRLAATRLLVNVQLPRAADHLGSVADDTDWSVVATVASQWPTEPLRLTHLTMAADVADALARRLPHLTKTKTVETGVIGSRQVRLTKKVLADLILQRAEPPYPDQALAAATPQTRQAAAVELAKNPGANAAQLVGLLEDRSAKVRKIVTSALTELTRIDTVLVEQLETLLKGKALGVRTAVLEVLSRQHDLGTSIQRLAAGTANQQRAAEELSGDGEGAKPEETAAPIRPLPAALACQPEDRTPALRPDAPDARQWAKFHDGCALVWRSLKTCLLEHGDVEVHTGNYGVQLLANLKYAPKPEPGGLPLADIVRPWWAEISGQLSAERTELLLLSTLVDTDYEWIRDLNRTILGEVHDEWAADARFLLLKGTVAHLSNYARSGAWVDQQLDLMATYAAALPIPSLAGPEAWDAAQEIPPPMVQVKANDFGRGIIYEYQDVRPLVFGRWGIRGRLEELSASQLGRLWSIERFIDEPAGLLEHPVLLDPEQPLPALPFRFLPTKRLLALAFDQGLATRADLVDAMLYRISRPEPSLRIRGTGGRDSLTRLYPEPWAASEALQATVADIARAIVEYERGRGEDGTALSQVARQVESVRGAESFVATVAALGNEPLPRGNVYERSRRSDLAHLIRMHVPAADDTPETFSKAVKRHNLSDKTILDLAIYVPQWAGFIEAHMGWPGLESAAWWICAHVARDPDYLGQDLKEFRRSEIAQRTPIEVSELNKGACDVEWFQACYDELGKERFGTLLGLAKFAAEAGGQRRAQIYAEAILGEYPAEDLLQQMVKKRHQDAIRAYGLAPLPTRGRRAELLNRYENLRGYVKSSKGGRQRRANELAAVEIALDNLARVAGYRDPQRLVWAMETEAVRDLADGPITAEDGDLTVTLSIDDDGQAELGVRRGDRVLKSIPAKSAKTPAIAELKERRAYLKSQVTRMRQSLESACVSGHAFEPAELAELAQHPILAPMLRRLVLVNSEGLVGFPTTDFSSLILQGKEHQPRGQLRVAHPIDLLRSGCWPELQHQVLTEQCEQPFKQVFRELYTLSSNERGERGSESRRYAGHRLDAPRAGGIFTSRGWSNTASIGYARTFHAEKVTARCQVTGDWGAEEGTVYGVQFFAAGKGTLALADVPERVFSEVMRDIDLVVSVAHASSVNPEASESTISMRAALVTETCQLLDLDNVQVDGHHAKISGNLGAYSVHLGSGVVHRIPGNAICIIAISTQQRGRIFLPFVDDDPRTAELVAKVVLLARDDKIKDPTILEQIT